LEEEKKMKQICDKVDKEVDEKIEEKFKVN